LLKFLHFYSTGHFKKTNSLFREPLIKLQYTVDAKIENNRIDCNDQRVFGCIAAYFKIVS